MGAAAAASIPVAGKSSRAIDKERIASLSAKKAARARNDREAGIGTKKGTGRLASVNAKGSVKAGKAARTNICLCGCGETCGGFFAMGHDAKYKSWMVKIERGTMQVKELPKSVQSANEFVKRGAGFVTKTNYKGEKHSGYDKAAAKA